MNEDQDMNRQKLLALGCVVPLLLSQLQLAIAKEPAVVPAAIFPFQERGSEVKELGGKVADLLFAHLATRPDLYLVERAELDKVLAEQELSVAGLIRADSANKVGQLTGARILVTDACRGCVRERQTRRRPGWPRE